MNNTHYILSVTPLFDDENGVIYKVKEKLGNWSHSALWVETNKAVVEVEYGR